MSEPPPPGLRLTEVSGRERCPLCRDEFQPESKVWSCRGCQTRYHQACQLELGGCSTLGCGGGGDGEGDNDRSPTPRQRARPEFGHCGACGAMAHRDDLEDCPACGARRHQACASQIGCGNAECGFQPRPGPSARELRTRSLTAGALLGFVGFMLIAFISSLWHGVLFPVFGFCAMLSLSLAVALNWVSFKTPTR